MNNIGQRIKDLRKKNNLTQEKLVDFLGVTYQSVSKRETGTSMPDLGIIVPLARVLQVSADEMKRKSTRRCTRKNPERAVTNCSPAVSEERKRCIFAKKS